jgi:hypothetical protein
MLLVRNDQSPERESGTISLVILYDLGPLLYAAGATTVNAPTNNARGIDSSMDY